MKKVSEHFSEIEFMCRCGCETFTPTEKLIDALEELRDFLSGINGKDCPIIVHCTVRCPKHNRKIGGVYNSRHLPKWFRKDQGACDFHVIGFSNRKLRKICLKLWKHKKILTGGLGLYSWGVHIDTSSRRVWGKWIYRV